MTISSECYGVYTDNDSLILSGKGNVSIYGRDNGVMLWGDDSKVLLNGTGDTVTLRGGEGSKAVFNGDTQSSPVAGTNIGQYDTVGSPDSAAVFLEMARRSDEKLYGSGRKAETIRYHGKCGIGYYFSHLRKIMPRSITILLRHNETKCR